MKGFKVKTQRDFKPHSSHTSFQTFNVIARRYAWEGKGLEFADVVAVNFFTDSEAKPAEWEAVLRGAGAGRVMLFDHGWGARSSSQRGGGDGDADAADDAPEEENADADDDTLRDPLASPEREAVMLEELKMLYVLCTRAKRRLIFVEADPQARAAFFDPARRANLATAGLPPGGARFAEASTAEEWRARGSSLLSTHRNY
jgi:ATP-dependent exoDNAse (exonuclease V) beta subunit